jgi:hypothetical protein
MSLYDGLLDLGPTKKEEDDKAKAKELPAHLKRKRLAPTGPPPPSVKKAEAKKTVELVAAPVLPPVALTSSAVDDPYDPAKPNSYEKIRGIREDGKKKQKTKPSIGKDLLLKVVFIFILFCFFKKALGWMERWTKTWQAWFRDLTSY